MNKSTITKTVKKVNSQDFNYSIGFRRLHALPVKARRSFNLAMILDSVDTKEIHQKQKNFLGALSDAQFISWLTLNA